MDILLRTIAIIIEIGLLSAIIGTIIVGFRLAVFDLGLGQRYSKIITMVMIMAGGLIIVFFIAHLASFYPAIGKG